MSTETLRQAFKHGTYARLNGQPREPTYDNPAHRAQWLKGWDCTNSNQTNYHTRKMAALDRIKREGRDAYRAGKVLSGCPYGSADMTKVEAWAEGFKAELNKRPTLCPKILYESNPCRHSFIDHKFASGGFAGKSQAALYIQQIGRILRDPTKPDPKEQKMKSTLAYIFASMLPEVIGVKVTFAGPFDKSYTYKALKSQNIEVGQFVVVDSPNSGLTVVTVKEVVAFDDLDPGAYQGYKWIVGPVFTGDYSAVTSKEQAFQAKVIELQRKAQREQAVAALAEQVGGLDALKAIMAELSAPTEAQPAPAAPAAE